MIDPLQEELVSFSEAAKSLPKRRAGRKVAVSTLYRWSNTGHAGVRLEYVLVGGTRCTSREAVARFIRNVTAKSAPDQVQETRSATPRQREAAIRRAAKELSEAGI